MPFSNLVKAGTINFWGRNQSVTQPTQLYLALYSTNPTGANTGTEITGGGYARQAVTFGAPAISGEQAVSSNTNAINFPKFTVAVGTAAHIAVLSAASGGDLIAYAQLPTSLQLNAGTQPYVDIGELKFTVT